MTSRRIEDGEVEHLVETLKLVLQMADDEARHEQLGFAVRAITRMWAQANPEFDRDAWYPVSYMLSEHWDRICDHMSADRTS